MTEAMEIIQTLPTALLCWYPFPSKARILYIGENEDVFVRMLTERDLYVTLASFEKLCDFPGAFDYVICIDKIEQTDEPLDTLRALKGVLAPQGVLLLGVHNRLGIRYFCGDRNPYTERVFDGLDGSASANFSGCMYSRAEMESLISQAGFTSRKFSSVLPGLEEPVFLYAEAYLPKEDLCNRLFPVYHSPASIFLDEKKLYQTLIDNGLFHVMANAYFVECTVDGKLSDMLHVTSSLERGRENAMITVIHDHGTVTKQAAYSESELRLRQLMQNVAELKAHGVPVVEGKLEQGILSMPYIKAETGQLYLKKLLLHDKEEFVRKMDQFRDVILSSSETYEGIYAAKQPLFGAPITNDKPVLLLRHAYLDLVPLNSFYINGQFVFFDQEFMEEDYPANVLLARMIATFYAGNPELHSVLPADELYNRYGILKEKDKWLHMEWVFLRKLRNEGILEGYHKKVRPDMSIITANRKRMNFSTEDYQRIFVDALENTDTRKLVLFGAGQFAHNFIETYHNDFPVYAVVDNDDRRWGERLAGIEISSPQILEGMRPGEYKVLICIRDYLPIIKQLENMGVREYSVFEPGKMYRRKRHPIVQEKSSEAKKYHVGYIAGVFDLFHIGHLNLFKRAKAQCDYLIVGVVSDRGVTEKKGVELFVPFEERVEMVRSCRYVDEVVEIPFVHCDTEDAWRMHHFDVQFSGSDYEHDARWLEKKAFLEEHGATMVFFPYTESTSSTKLKKLIEKKLL